MKHRRLPDPRHSRPSPELLRHFKTKAHRHSIWSPSPLKPLVACLAGPQAFTEALASLALPPDVLAQSWVLVVHNNAARLISHTELVMLFKCDNGNNDRGIVMLIPSIRKIHNHNSDKVIGFSYSHRMNGLIPWESTLERDWLLHLEANPSVKTIQSQPQRFDYFLNGKWHLYTPDFEVHWKDALNRLPTIYEVKPEEISADNAFNEKANAIGVQLAQLGYEFVVVDRKTIREGNHLKNLNYLKHYADVFVTHRDRQLIADYLLKAGPCTLTWLTIRLNSKYLSLCGLYHLLWEGWLEYDKQKIINPLLKVHLAEGVKNDYSA